MNVIHLTASRFFGGPERQMLGLALAMPEGVESAFVSFREGGNSRSFLDEVRTSGLKAVELKNDTPRLAGALRELIELIRRMKTDVLCCHGYKANLLGLLAARRVGIPVVSVSRGWTAETFRVRLYEILDRLVLRRMDKVVCVSQSQARKVRRAGVPADKTAVIRNAVRPERFTRPDPKYRDRLERLFAAPPMVCCRWLQERCQQCS